MKCSRLLLLLPALAAASILWAEPRVKTGLDVLIDRDFAPIAGKRVGVITNHTGLTSDGRHIVDVLSRSSKVKLVAIFTPEHGLAGTQDDPNVASGTHEATGTPIYSLYNRGSYRPTPQMLQKVDVLIYDIQDIGARFYTYITTLGYALEEAARAGKSFLVLDRPNPINGIAVEGPLLDPRYVSFVGYMRMPIRHGMTVGELARMYNGEKALHADLQVIEMQGWSRNMWLDATGLEWVNPSPNIRNLTQAILYPGSCLLESDQVSVGRGTDTPFQIIGAPWFKGREVAEYLNGLAIPGVRFLARRFRPTASVFKDEDCEGLDIQLIDRDALDSVRLGLELLYATMKFHPGKFNLEGVMRLLGNEDAAGRLKRGEAGSAVVKSYAPDLDQFRKTREKYLIYR